METSYHTSLGAHQAAHVSVQSSLFTSNGSPIHKATVLIEPPVVKKVLPEPIAESSIIDDEYVVRLQPVIPSALATAETSPITTELAVSIDTPSASTEIAPPVVWLAGGCGNSPASAPALINFELAPISQETTTPITTMLPFSAHRFDLDEKKTTVTETPQIETPTPKPDTTEDNDISHSGINDSLTYSTTFTQAESRTTGLSPPVESYAHSPTNFSLAYSQASHGVSFAGPSTSAPITFGADSYAGPASYAGPSCSASVPSYGGPVSAPISYASSE